MPHKPDPLKMAAWLPGGDKRLAVKDGLREVRFHVKHSARKLVQDVEAATHRHDDEARGPLGLLGEPLNLAVRATAHFLSSVDHAAVDVLSSDGPYRAMTVQLRTSASYFSTPASAAALRGFATDHHWRYRHWLAMKQIADVFVHEQAIALAGGRLASAGLEDGASPLATNTHRRATVPVIQALMRAAILAKPALLTENDDHELAALKELSELGAVVVVLAGEVAALLPEIGQRERYVRALQLADEIAAAERPSWQGALQSLAPADALGRWVAFALRHV